VDLEGTINASNDKMALKEAQRELKTLQA